MIVPLDTEGHVPDITQIEVPNSAFGSANMNSSMLSQVSNNQTVTLYSSSTTEVIHDAVFTLTSTTSGSTVLDTAAGSTELLSVEEPLALNASTAGQINTGDSFVVNGTTYYIIGLKQYNASVTHDGGTTFPDITQMVFSTSPGGAEAGSLLVPGDHEGNLVNITSMTV
ncbi:MAG: hypothetical protein ACPG77_09885, partial [Nannocystaceae bacterium]